MGARVVTVYNPDQYMASLRTIIAQGRKRVGLLIGAGGPAGMAKADGTYPLIPSVDGLTKTVFEALQPEYKVQIDAINSELDSKNIEAFLSRVRSLSQVIGTGKIHDLDGKGFEEFGNKICEQIGKVVDVRLPNNTTAYSSIVSWIVGTMRDYPIEIFTTNYDLLFEEALEAVRAPYFDGFTGGHEPFFDSISVAKNDLPARWTRLWKVHGSLGWKPNSQGEVIRTGGSDATHLVFPEHLKYDQTEKAPYSALLDRLRAFLLTKDTLLVSIGFSYSDAHIAARIGEGLGANPSASVFAFQFKKLDEELCARELGSRLPNFSVYARDGAIINGSLGKWSTPSALPTPDWGAIRSSYWNNNEFTLGAMENFGAFFAASKSPQAFQNPVAVPTVEG
jgi:hypothetical protein